MDNTSSVVYLLLYIYIEINPKLRSFRSKIYARNMMIMLRHRIWFLNAFWTKDVKFEDTAKSTDPKKQQAEIVWQYNLLCEELDDKGEEGNELDDIKAHQVIEKLGNAKTHMDFKELMKTIDLDYNGKVSMTEFLVLHFNVDWKTLGKAGPGSG